MRAGLLRHRIQLQSRTLAANSLGEPIETWSTYATVSARISPLSGRERWAAMQHAAETTHRIEIRAKAGIKAEDRIIFETRTFRIDAILDKDERGIEMQLLCKEEIP
jgi:SPP1 family predicted phage head-tail adaptor